MIHHCGDESEALGMNYITKGSLYELLENFEKLYPEAAAAFRVAVSEMDVEPLRRGERKKTEDNGKESIECTACGAYWCYRVPSDIYLSDANYCPNCGAKMEVE